MTDTDLIHDDHSEMVTFTDTHCHIQEESYADGEAAYARALEAGVRRMVCVGTDVKTSREAVAFAAMHPQAWAAIGIHPHEAARESGRIDELRALLTGAAMGSDDKPAVSEHPVVSRQESFSSPTLEAVELPSVRQSSLRQVGAEKHFGLNKGYPVTAGLSSAGEYFAAATDVTSPPSNSHLPIAKSVLSPSSNSHLPIAKIVAIGEIGLDYFYTHSPREVQIEMLEAQIQLALDHDLPISFHVREAFEDFWPILSNFQGVAGVLHSFTDTLSNMERALSQGLLIGVNGISTFARDRQDVYQIIPYTQMLLETDAPYLTPVPLRGTVNEPALLMHVASHIANLQSINLTELSRATEASATRLLNLK